MCTRSTANTTCSEGRLDLTLTRPSTHERYVAHRFVNTRAVASVSSQFIPLPPSLSLFPPRFLCCSDTAAAIRDLDHTQDAQSARINRCLLIIMVTAAAQVVAVVAKGQILKYLSQARRCHVDVTNGLAKKQKDTFVSCCSPCSPPRLSTLPFVRLRCLKQAFEDHTRSVQFFLQVLLPLRRLLLVLTFLGGCCHAGASSCLGRGKPAKCWFLGPFYVYAAMLLAARSKRARQTTACALLGSGACVP